MLIENGQTHIFFSRWGALTIPSVLLSGPEATLTYIRKLTPVEALLNNIWAEGGVLLDVDTRRVLFWGGSAIAERPYLRRPLLEVLPFLWPTWSIDWARFGVADLAQSIGWDIVRVLENGFDDTAFLAGNEAVATEAQLQESLKTVGPGTILTIRWNSGEVRDYRFFVSRGIGTSMPSRFSATPYQILSLGPQVLTLLRTTTPTRRLPKEDSTKAPQKGAYIDEKAQTLWVWETETLDPRYLDALTRRWPGWQVHGHVEGLVRQVILSGRDPALLSVSMRQAILELTDELTRDQSIDPLQVSQAIRQALPPEDQPEIRFGTGFFSKDTSPLSPQERRDVLNRLFSELLENDQMKRGEEHPL